MSSSGGVGSGVLGSAGAGGGAGGAFGVVGGGVGSGFAGVAGGVGDAAWEMVPGEPMSGRLKTPPGLQARAPWTPALERAQSLPTFIEAWDGMGM